MSKHLHIHRWHYATVIPARGAYPAIYKFVCDKYGCVKLIEGDLQI